MSLLKRNFLKNTPGSRYAARTHTEGGKVKPARQGAWFQTEFIVMNIVIAMDSFKGSLSSLEAGNAVQTGILPMRRPPSVPSRTAGRAPWKP